MEDGIDQKIITPGEIFRALREGWCKECSDSSTLVKLRDELMKPDIPSDDSNPGEARDRFTVFKTNFTAAMINESATLYGDATSEDIRNGTRQGLLDNTDADRLLESLKDIARRFLYPADRVQRPFIAGLRVIHGILDEYGRILSLTQEQFALLRESWGSANRKRVSDQGLETLLPLLDNLPLHYLDVYDSAIEDSASKSRWGAEAWELYCRAHLVVDYLSGMTDDFAFHTYQVISGVRLD